MGRGTGSLGGAPPRAEQRGTARSPAGSSRSHTNSVHRSAPARKPLGGLRAGVLRRGYDGGARHEARQDRRARGAAGDLDRKSTRLNSSHGYISYAVFCLKKKKNYHDTGTAQSSVTTQHD